MNKLLSNMLAGIGAVVVARTLADNFTIVRRNDEDEAVKALSEIKYEAISDARDILEKAKKTLHDYDWVSVADILDFADELGYSNVALILRPSMFPAYSYGSDRGWSDLDSAFVYSAYHLGHKVYRIHFPKSQSVNK